MNMKRTKKNPHGLTGKQRLMAEDIITKVKSGKSVTPVDSVKKVYNVSTHDSARTIASRNMANPDFRAALIDGWSEKQIIGNDSHVQKRTEEGLDATDREGNVDYTNRLKYIQEINKVTGVYAADKKEVKTLSLTMDMSEDALDAKIEELKEELKAK